MNSKLEIGAFEIHFEIVWAYQRHLISCKVTDAMTFPKALDPYVDLTMTKNFTH